MKTTIFTLLTVSICLSACNSGKQWLEREINLKSVETRRDFFNMVRNKEVVGKWIWETEVSEKAIIFKDTSVLTGIVQEHFELKFDKAKMHTVFIDMETIASPNRLKVDITRTSNKDLKGQFKMSGSLNRSKSIDTTYQTNTIIRAEIFGLIAAIKDFPSLDLNLNTFFMSSATSGEMKLKYMGEEEVKVPAGQFDTYKIVFEGKGQVSNMIYIKKALPHRIVKVDVIGQQLSIELTQL